MTYSASIISDMLIEAGIKPSIHRISILHYMLTHRTHPNVDEIYRQLLPDYPTISRTTVYNTLKLLAEKGVVTCLDIDSSNIRYDYISKPHAHFICKRCGIIIDVETTELPPPPIDLDIDEIQLNYKGTCPKCKQQNQNI